MCTLLVSELNDILFLTDISLHPIHLTNWGPWLGKQTRKDNMVLNQDIHKCKTWKLEDDAHQVSFSKDFISELLDEASVS